MRSLFPAILAVFSLVSFAELDALNQLQKQAADMAAGASGGSRDIEAADYLMGKFNFGEDGKPAWYPEVYPNSDEMDSSKGFKPRVSLIKDFQTDSVLLAPVLEIFKKKNSFGNCEENLIPPLLSFQLNLGNEFCTDVSKGEAKKYLVDHSGLASLEQSPNENNHQSALISVFNMDALSDEQKTKLMTDPNTTVKTVFDSLSSDAQKQALVDPRRVSLLKYNPHKDYPLGLGSITAQVGSMSLDIPVTLPPEPECSLRIAPGQVEPFQPGSTVRFELSANSVTVSAKKIDGELELGEEFDVSLENAPRFLASSFGSSQKLVDFEFTIPQDFSGLDLPGHPTEMGWMVSAKVAGIVGNNYQSCQLSEPARVQRPPAPDCSLVASPQEADPGAQVTLTLSKRSPALIVSEAFIGETDVSESMKSSGRVEYSYSRTDSPSETVTATLKGPGGERTCSVTLNAVQPACPWERYDYWAVPTYKRCFRTRTRRKCNAVSFGGQQYGRTLKSFGNYTTEEGNNGAAGARKISCGADRLCLVSYLSSNPGHYTAISIGGLGSSSCSVKQVFSRGGGCFTPDTQIKMANGTLKLASDIAENDFVFNPHYNTGVRVRKVVKGPEKKSLYEVSLGSKKVEVTEDHPFLTGRGWVQAMSLKKGDTLLGNGSPKFVRQVKKLKYQGPQDVWNFELDTEDPMAHVVMANGIPTGDLVTQLELKKPKAKLP